jgi:hypothetical protein
MRALLLLLVSASASAQIYGAGLSPSALTPANAPQIVQATTAALTLYVDPTGSDSNACTAIGTAACATIQGALNKAPKLLRHQVTISVAAGTYGGFYVSGFTQDVTSSASTGLIIDGALANSTLATGSPTGTAAGAGQLAGSGSTFGVLCDSGATWTVNDLRGRFITTASPTNTAFVISSNTATCATIVGTWSVPVAGTTTYTIQDSAVIVNTAVSRPATPTVAASANYAAVAILGNAMNYQTRALVLRSLRLTNTTGDGVRVEDISAILFNQMQVIPTGTSKLPLFIATATGGGGGPIITIERSLLQGNNDNAGLQQSGGSLSISNTLVYNSADVGDLPAVQLISCKLGFFSGNELRGWAVGLGITNGPTGTTATSNILNSRVVCRSHAGSAGIWFGVTPALSTSILGGFTTGIVSAVDIATCEIGLQTVGTSTIDVVSLSGSVSVTGFAGFLGGMFNYTKAGVTLTATTNELNLDAATATSTFTSVTAGQCLTTSQGSRACAR